MIGYETDIPSEMIEDAKKASRDSPFRVLPI